ncbi:hypothetical protein CYMTET_26733 [Cymbomonas tetramitiformis]|uniref:arginyltransferase n=1 Tax=Cymbomonas tetramitiformis TaxID=36881 RepID=A0AAE0FRQ9_9CHLO|nr:hypothetical protein CYMTET_26733 [Cymbomonas tetramitiformis]
MPPKVSIVQDHGEYAAPCGYCKSSGDTNIAHGMWAHRLTVEDYQALIDRGWRRSGTWIYKPNLQRTCCPPFTIRVDVREFESSKEHRKVMRRMEAFLELVAERGVGSTGSLKDLMQNSALSDASEPSTAPSGGVAGRAERPPPDDVCRHLQAALDEGMRRCISQGILPQETYPPCSVQDTSKGKQRVAKTAGPPGYSRAYSCAAPRAATGIAFRKHGNKIEASVVAESVMHSPAVQNAAQKAHLRISSDGGYINFWRAGEGGAASSSQGAQTARKATSSQAGPSVSRPASVAPVQPPDLTLFVLLENSARLRRDAWLMKTGPRHCQRRQADMKHDAGVRSREWRQADVKTEVRSRIGGQADVVVRGLCHRRPDVHRRLIAVGVVDILPHCLSSKYFFWDPDLAKLSLGKFSALQEIDWVARASRTCPKLTYYYLGFYIHSCPKMLYKAKYKPSSLLCPFTYRWVQLTQIKAKLDQPCTAPLLPDDAGVPTPTISWNGAVAPEMRQQVELIQSIIRSQILQLKTPTFCDEANMARLLAEVTVLIPGKGLLPLHRLVASNLPHEMLSMVLKQMLVWCSAVGEIVAKRVAYVLDLASLIQNGSDDDEGEMEM